MAHADVPLSRRAVIGAGIASAGCSAFVSPTPDARTLDLRDFGAAGDGRSDDGPALRAALARLSQLGGTLHVPAGDFLIEDRTIAAGETPFRIPVGATIAGSGSSSRLIFRRTTGAAFYGLTVAGEDIALHDMTLAVDTGGSGWTSAIGIIAPTMRLSLTRVAFRGLGGRAGHLGILPIDADLDEIIVDRCSFRSLDFGFSRQTSDTADHRRLQFLDCLAEDCTEVFEFNAPGLSRGVTRRGSPLLTDMTDDDGLELTPRLRVGQRIRSTAFPDDTRVVAIEENRTVRLSRPALADMPPDRAARISAGRCSAGIIHNLRCSRIAQWAVGMAHCDGWDVSIRGSDVQYELVHLEDGCSNIRIVADGIRCNLSPGVVGSPAADNGMVHVSTGCHDIAVRFVRADLTQNHGPFTSALCLQPGIMGTTGMRRATAGVRVGGVVLLHAGTRAVTAYETDIRFDDLEMRNVDPDSRASPMLRLPGCRISGTVAVLNPGTVLEAGFGASGDFDNVRVLSN